MSQLNSGLIVYKLTGSGNDFVMIDGRTTEVADWPPDKVRLVCDRRSGVGADGLVVIGPGSGEGRVRFTFFNSDGSEAPMCGNGALCATRLAAHLGLASREGMVLETGAGDYQTNVCGAEEARIRLEDADSSCAPEIPLQTGERSITLMKIGVPHVVVHVDDVEQVDLMRRGAEIRYSKALPEGGANVNFVGEADGRWAMRTYERGVEGETLACGTGATCCAAVLASQGVVTLPWSVTTRSGQTLHVEGKVDTSLGSPNIASPMLTGQAKIVFRAVLEG